MPEKIETFLWKGQLRYRCPLKWESGDPCAYDTYDQQLLREHMRNPHSRTGKTSRESPQELIVDSPILDPKGEPFKKTVPLPEEFRNLKFKG